MARSAKYRLTDLVIDRIDRCETPDNDEARILLAKSRQPKVVPDDSVTFSKRHATRAERRQANHARVRAAIEELIDLGVDPTEAAKVVLGRRDGTRALADFTASPSKKESPMSSDHVLSKIAEAAEAIRKDNPDLTAEQAQLRAFDDDPDLYTAWKEAREAEPVLTGEPPVQKSTVGETFRDRVGRLVQERADELVTEKNIDPVRAYEIALDDRVLKQAMWWSRQPSARQPVTKACAELVAAGMPGEVTRALI